MTYPPRNYIRERTSPFFHSLKLMGEGRRIKGSSESTIDFSKKISTHRDLKTTPRIGPTLKGLRFAYHYYFYGHISTFRREGGVERNVF